MSAAWEPLAETLEAVDEHGPFTLDGEDLLVRLRSLAAQVSLIVPDCVGISLTVRDLDVTFTLLATDHRLSVLDAVQYLDGGPCVDAVDSHHPTTSAVGDPLDEDRWRLFSAAKAADGIASTLSLPILSRDTVAAGFNLYATSPHAFDGRHEAISALVGAWPAGAVTNADLAFSTLRLAREAPARLQQDVDLTRAAGLLARRTDVDRDQWEKRIRLAAEYGGVPLADLIELILRSLGEDRRR